MQYTICTSKHSMFILKFIHEHEQEAKVQYNCWKYILYVSLPAS